MTFTDLFFKLKGLFSGANNRRKRRVKNIAKRPSRPGSLNNLGQKSDIANSILENGAIDDAVIDPVLHPLPNHDDFDGLPADSLMADYPVNASAQSTNWHLDHHVDPLDNLGQRAPRNVQTGNDLNGQEDPSGWLLETHRQRKMPRRAQSRDQDRSSGRAAKKKFSWIDPESWSPQLLMGALVLVLCAAIMSMWWVGPNGHAEAQSVRNNGRQSASDNGGIETPTQTRATALNIRDANGVTEIELITDRAVAYRIFALPSPTPRLVIDTARLSFRFPGAGAGQLGGAGLVQTLRFAQKSDTQSRFVLDLTGPVQITQREDLVRMGGRVLRIRLTGATARQFATMATISEGTLPQAALPTDRANARARAVASVPGRQNHYVIVVDAGHGGQDPGALAPNAPTVASANTNPFNYEKAITLASALELARILRQNPAYQVVLTRDSDRYLSLPQRIVLARDHHADLFISIHADAAGAESAASGATVYTLSEEGSQRSRRLLDNENWSAVPESAEGDPELATILRDLTQRDTTNQSAIFAQLLVEQISTVGPVTHSSHRRRGFYVLLSPTVPALLLETGFISNAEDHARLSDPGFRHRQMAAAARAIDRYFQSRPSAATAAPTPKGDD